MSVEKTYEDIVVSCRKCKNNFLFEGEEQKLFEEKGFKPRSLCFYCRPRSIKDKEARRKKLEFEEEISKIEPRVYYCKICKMEEKETPKQIFFRQQCGFEPRKKCLTCKNREFTQNMEKQKQQKQ